MPRKTTEAPQPGDTASAFARLVDREIQRLRTDLECEREMLLADAAIDVGALEVAHTTVYAERQAYRETTKASDTEQHEAMIEFSRRESEAGEAVRRGRDARDIATRRIAEIDLLSGGEATAELALRDRDEIIEALRQADAELAKRRMAIARIVEGIEGAERALASARTSELDRIAAEIERGAQPAVGDGAATLAHQERVIEAHRGLLARAETEAGEIVARIAQTRERMADVRGRYNNARFAHARLRWLAVQRLIAGEMLVQAVGQRLAHRPQEFPLPRVNDFEVIQAVREVDAEFVLPPIVDHAVESDQAPIESTDDAQVEAA